MAGGYQTAPHVLCSGSSVLGFLQLSGGWQECWDLALEKTGYNYAASGRQDKGLKLLGRNTWPWTLAVEVARDSRAMELDQ